MNRENKITEGQIQLDDRNNYQPLDKPMVGDTFQRVKHLINSLRQAGCIDEMTAKWFNQTPDPPRIPVFYTLTKIHKPTLVGRPIISGCDGLTERLSSFPSGVDKVLQPIAQIQESYLKDTTHFIRFIESTRVPKNAFLVSMDVTSMYTNIPQEEGITIVCNAYENFYSVNKPLPWKRFIYEVFCLWDTNKEEIEHFIEQANSYHPTIKFTAEVSQLETTFLDTTVYKGERFEKEPILDVRTHYKPTETLQYTNYNSCHPAGVKKGFVKEEALRLLRTNSSKVMFEENIKNFRTRLTSRGYPNNLVEKILSEVKFAERKNALTQKTESAQENSTLCDTISSITAMFEKYSNRKMAFNTKPAATKRDIQGTSLDLL